MGLLGQVLAGGIGTMAEGASNRASDMMKYDLASRLEAAKALREQHLALYKEQRADERSDREIAAKKEQTEQEQKNKASTTSSGMLDKETGRVLSWSEYNDRVAKNDTTGLEREKAQDIDAKFQMQAQITEMRLNAMQEINAAKIEAMRNGGGKGEGNDIKSLDKASELLGDYLPGGDHAGERIPEAILESINKYREIAGMGPLVESYTEGQKGSKSKFFGMIGEDAPEIPASYNYSTSEQPAGMLSPKTGEKPQQTTAEQTAPSAQGPAKQDKPKEKGFVPGKKLIQNGVVFVVGDDGVPRPEDSSPEKTEPRNRFAPIEESKQESSSMLDKNKESIGGLIGGAADAISNKHRKSQIETKKNIIAELERKQSKNGKLSETEENKLQQAKQELAQLEGK